MSQDLGKSNCCVWQTQKACEQRRTSGQQRQWWGIDVLVKPHASFVTPPPPPRLLGKKRCRMS